MYMYMYDIFNSFVTNLASRLRHPPSGFSLLRLDSDWSIVIVATISMYTTLTRRSEFIAMTTTHRQTHDILHIMYMHVHC